MKSILILFPEVYAEILWSPKKGVKAYLLKNQSILRKLRREKE